MLYPYMDFLNYSGFIRIWTAVQPMAGNDGLKYQGSDGQGSVIHTVFVRFFAAMGSPLFNLDHGQFPVHSGIRLREPGAA